MLLKCNERDILVCPQKPKIRCIRVYDNDSKNYTTKYSVFCACNTLDSWFDTRKEAKKAWNDKFNKT